MIEFEKIPDNEGIDIDNIFNNFQYLDESERYLYTYNTENLYQIKKTTETSLNHEQDKDLLIKSENIHCINIINEKEEVSEGIDKIFYNYPNIHSMIKGFINNKGTVTKLSIFYHIAERYDTNPESEDFEFTILQIDKTLRQMEENQEINKDYDKYSMIEGAVK